MYLSIYLPLFVSDCVCLRLSLSRARALALSLPPRLSLCRSLSLSLSQDRVGFLNDATTMCSFPAVSGAGTCAVDPFAVALTGTLWLGVHGYSRVTDGVSEYVRVTIDEDASTVTSFSTGNALTESVVDVLASVASGSESGACGCDYVLTGAKLTVLYDDSGALTGASAAVQFAKATGNTCAALWVAQTFSVEFVPAEVTFTQSFALGNLVQRGKSGNPGYVVGLPVLSGALQPSSYEVVEELVSTVVDTSRIVPAAGLSLATFNTRGGCDGGGGDGDVAGSQLVAFGQNASFTCVLSLTLAQLMARCEDEGLAYDNVRNGSYIGE